jgi:HK97 family phage major capsid protein
MDKKEIEQIVSQLREANEKLDAGAKNQGELKEKIAKLEKVLNEQETKNQEVTKKFVEQENIKKDIEKKYSELEKAVHRNGFGENKNVSSEHKKAFDKFVIGGKEALTPEDVKYLRTDINPQGGYLVPSEYVTEITKKITEISPIRNLASIRTTTRMVVEVPKRDTLMTAYWVGEGESKTKSQSAYGMDVWHINKIAAIYEASEEVLSDSAFNIENEINSDFTEAFAQLEGAAFVNGTGVKEPEGFMQNASITVTNTGIANDIAPDPIILMAGELKTGYNPVYGLNRKTLAAVRTLKTGMGDYIWQNGLAAGLPNTINGYPYVEIPDMPDIGAGTEPIVFADFRRGYLIIDNPTMTMLRDPYFLGTDNIIRFIGHKRLTGKVRLPEAFQKLKCST